MDNSDTTYTFLYGTVVMHVCIGYMACEAAGESWTSDHFEMPFSGSHSCDKAEEVSCGTNSHTQPRGTMTNFQISSILYHVAADDS